MNFPETSLPYVPQTEIEPSGTYRKLDVGDSNRRISHSNRYSSKIIVANSKQLRVEEDDEDDQGDKQTHKPGHRKLPKIPMPHKKPKKDKPKILGRVAKMQYPDWKVAVLGIVAAVIVGG